jgi:hypothetical protein
MKEESKERLRSSLDDILGHDLPDEVPGLEDTPQLPRIRIEETQQQGLVKARNKAAKVMNNLLKFYLSEEIIEEQEYIKAKAELDQSALSMLIRQMQNSEHAITILMDTINEGDVAPRMFEVLSDLQRTLLDIIKSQTMYIVAVEENVKKIARDLDIYQGKSTTNNKTNENSGIKARGQKELMRALRNTIDEENVQDVDPIYDEDEE